MPTENQTSKEVEMNTVKRLILIEATFQRIPNYTGSINDIMCIHLGTQVINDLDNTLKEEKK